MSADATTQSSDPSIIQGWTPTLTWIQDSSRDAQVSGPKDMRPCGCGIKLDLEDILYPALNATAPELATRVDAHVSPGRYLEARRFVVPVSQLSAQAASLAKEFSGFGADTLIELFSTSRDGFIDRQETKNEVGDLMRRKVAFLKQIPDVRFGKGHSIRAGGDLMVFDALKHDAKAPGFAVSNNDTIITADSILRHFAPISVFTALNNALNDLYLMGASEDLTVRPVYDGGAEDIARIQATLRTYASFHRARGVNLHIVDEGPLRAGIQVVGATVIGHTRKNLPGLTGLRPGQDILLSRFLGDLSLLSMHRGRHFDGASDELKRARLEVLQRFGTSNYLVSQVLREFLPDAGEEFNPDRHVPFASDISGPGLSVLEEGALQSGVDVAIDDLRFIDERSLKFYRKNQTSSTNGPLMFAAAPAVIRRLESRLHDIGLKEVWRLGRVLSRSAAPTIRIHPSLEERYASKDPRMDFFAPEVHFGSPQNPVRERMPIFRRFVFST